jgi:hypothetical protein
MDAGHIDTGEPVLRIYDLDYLSWNRQADTRSPPSIPAGDWPAKSSQRRRD